MEITFQLMATTMMMILGVFLLGMIAVDGCPMAMYVNGRGKKMYSSSLHHSNLMCTILQISVEIVN